MIYLETRPMTYFFWLSFKLSNPIVKTSPFGGFISYPILHSVSHLYLLFSVRSSKYL